MKLAFVDLFCGAGGTTTGVEQAELFNEKIASVIACVNHDIKAIRSHAANHPSSVHFTEDIRSMDLSALKAIVEKYRAENPDHLICIWASLECTNFSKAKGGLPRDADSRTLANSLFMIWDKQTNEYSEGDSYIQLINPDYILIENVVEFMSWGDLDENGKPISKKAGRNWMQWKEAINKLGYYDQWTELNSANYGAYTSRNRLFGAFAKHGLPIVFPETTHAKVVKKNLSLFNTLKPWKAVKDVLDFSDEGKSIFREKPLSEKTLSRIYAGLIKYIAGGNKNFLLKYNSVSSKGEFKHTVSGINDPCPVIATQARLGIVETSFLSKYFSGDPENKNSSVNSSAGAITTIDHHSLVRVKTIDQFKDHQQETEFIASYYGNGDNVSSVKNPAPVITTKDRLSIVKASFIDKTYGSDKNHQSVEQPSGTILANDKHNLVQVSRFIDKQFSSGGRDQSIDQPLGSITTVNKNSIVSVKKFIMDTQFTNSARSIDEPLGVITANRKHFYLMNPQWQINSGSSIEQPCFTLIARMDKTPPYLITTESGALAIEIYENDSEMTVKIKEFMALYGIVDIKMRMLKVRELLKIQGFPDDYILHGNQTDQKKFIGNSVAPIVPKKWIEALVAKLRGTTIYEIHKTDFEKVAI